MKFLSFLSFAALSVSVLLPSTGFALVRELAKCVTGDGRYQISVQDNQGIGRHRVSHLSAQVITSENIVVATYKVKTNADQIRSPSFGRFEYQDIGTRGASFNLGGPSTNFRNYILSVKIQGGLIVKDQDLACSIFKGVILQN